MFAAGNRPGPLKYPAVYKEIVAVTALGKYGVGPEGSMVRFHEMHNCACKSKDLYAWQCASGEGVGCIAAGVGLIMNMDGRPHTDVSGTSFSCPIAAGVLAAALAENKAYLKLQGEARARNALGKLQSICAADVFPLQFAGAGVPIYSRLEHGNRGSLSLGAHWERTRLA
jgi:subtilisin